MKRFLLFLIVGFSSKTFCQPNELIGKWILDKTVYSDGKLLEINNPLFSSKSIYEIRPNYLSINNQNLKAQFSPNQIKLEHRILEFWTEENYLLVQEKDDNKIHLFLKADDFIIKYPEFKPKTEIRNNDTITIANEIIGAEFNNELTFDEFLWKNMPDHPSKSFSNLYFNAEFILTRDNKIKEIKILNSISKDYDNEFLLALKKAEKYFVNNLKTDIVVNKENNFLKWKEDLNKNEKYLYDLISNGDAYYMKNEFAEAIVEYEKIKELNIEKNRFNIMIREAYIKLGVSYLAINQKEKACSTFQNIGKTTNFWIRNYLINFCN